MITRSSNVHGLFILILLSALSWTITVLMRANIPGATNALWVMTGLALLLTIIASVFLGIHIMALCMRLLHHPVVVIVDKDGVRQTGSRGETIDLRWEDIRLIQHRRFTHLVRGRDKKQRIKILKLLVDHETLSAFLKFAFLLRQEIGIEWRDLLTEVRSRLDGPGFHFHYDGDRTNAIHINSSGIKHSSSEGTESEMSWDLMRKSVLEIKKYTLNFHHTGSKTSITLPRGTDSDEIIEEFIRWALHNNLNFSSNSA